MTDKVDKMNKVIGVVAFICMASMCLSLVAVAVSGAAYIICEMWGVVR